MRSRVRLLFLDADKHGTISYYEFLQYYGTTVWICYTCVRLIRCHGNVVG